MEQYSACPETGTGLVEAPAWEGATVVADGDGWRAQHDSCGWVSRTGWVTHLSAARDAATHDGVHLRDAMDAKREAFLASAVTFAVANAAVAASDGVDASDEAAGEAMRVALEAFRVDEAAYKAVQP